MPNQFISVIIPSRNEENYIQECLDSLLSQNYPKDKCEVIVVDGMSTDRTREIITKYPNVQILDNPKLTAPAGTNIGIKAARGEIIIRVDAHTKVAPDFLLQNIKYLNETKADCVGGPIQTIGKGYKGKAIACVLSSPFGTGSKFRFSQKSGYVDTVPFGAYRKEIFDRLGLLNENLPRSEDLEFNHRIIKAGGKIFLSPDIKSDYYCRTGFRKLVQQNFFNGYDSIRSALKDPKSISVRHVVPLLFVLGVLISILLSLFSILGIYLGLIILLSYGITNITFSVMIAVKYGWKYILLVPALFLILHLCYGVGSIAGLFHHWSK